MKRLIISLFICSSYLINCPAQTPSSDTLSETVYEWAEVMPEVEGGNQALLKAIVMGIRRDSTAESMGYIGSKIAISFIVTTQGQLTDIRFIINSFGPNSIEPITKNIKSLIWHPGRQNGKPVAVRYRHSTIIEFD